MSEENSTDDLNKEEAAKSAENASNLDADAHRLGAFWSKKVANFLMGAGVVLLLGAFVSAFAGANSHAFAGVEGFFVAAGDATLHHGPLARFFFSYLASFSFFSAIAIGSIFFVVLQSLTRSGWSVSVRRIPEVYSMNIVLMAVLALPILAFGMHDLYHWTDPKAVEEDYLLKAKEPYLNTIFFYLRVVFYFAFFSACALFYYRRSTAQDRDGDLAHTHAMQRFSPPLMILFALSTTFFSLDFLMSLMPHWYSTIWGVYYFASGVVASLAVFILSFLFLRSIGKLKSEVNVEHYHDLGKLLYAFNVFWCYIAFSQYMLIWYANIPETTIFFLERINGSWRGVSIALIVGHGAIPLLFYLSRNVKRNLKGQLVISSLLLVMEMVNIYWIVLPNIDKAGFAFNQIDAMLLLGMAGLFFGLFLRNLGRASLLAKGDPRLGESLAFENA